MSKTILTPQVLWAQTNNVIYLTINLADIKNEKIDFLPGAVKFSGDVEDRTYGFDLQLHEEYDIEKSRKSVTAHRIFLVIQKKEDALGFWPRLHKGGQKPSYIKIDFSRWVEEDEEEEEGSQIPEGNEFPMGGDYSDEDYEDEDEDSINELEAHKEVVPGSSSVPI